MPDIAMCANAYCPRRTRCYRFTAKPSGRQQSYARLRFWSDGDEFECDYFWPLIDEGEGDNEKSSLDHR